MNCRYKILSDIDDYEDFSKYAIDVEGNLWSLKYNKPRLRKSVWSNGYLSAKVRDDRRQPKTLYIHKLVALAFLPCDDPSRRVSHRNKDRSDNRLENIEWIANKEDKQQALNYILQQSLIDRILRVHIAAQKKGLRVSDSYSFTTEMIENAIEGYIKQYGLHKVMSNL